MEKENQVPCPDHPGEVCGCHKLSLQGIQKSTWGKPFPARLPQTSSTLDEANLPLFIRELMGITPGDEAKKIKEFIAHELKPETRAKRKEELANLLKEYEKKHGFSSAELLCRHKSLAETGEFCDWYVYANMWVDAHGILPR